MLRVPAESLSEIEVLQHHPRQLARASNLVFHAALMSSPSRAIALTGASGMGKSSLSAGLRAHGWTLLGDDTMVVSKTQNHFAAHAVFPQLRLKPDAVRALGGDEATGIDITGKHVFRLPDIHKPKPLTAIFVLDVAQENVVSVERLRPADACLAIVANSFAHAPDDLDEASKRFGLAADLASRVPVFCLGYPRNFGIISRVEAAIVNTLDGVIQSEGA